LEVVAKAIHLSKFLRHLLIFSLDRLCARLQCGLFQGCGAFAKMSKLRLRSFSFHEHGCGSSSGALGFHESGFRAQYFHGSSSGFCSFSHFNML